MKQQIFCVYAEFDAPEILEKAETNLMWRPMKQYGMGNFVIGCRRDDPGPNFNPLVLRIRVWGMPELPIPQIAELAPFLEIRRVTHNFQEIYPRAPDSKPKRRCFFIP